MLRVAMPNKGSLSEPAAEILREAGYRGRRESKELVVFDADNDGIACETYFGTDGSDAADRTQARTINAGVPDVAGPNTLGLLGGGLLVLSGIGVAVRARRAS